MFCTFLMLWKHFPRMFTMFHSIGFPILVSAITKFLASLTQPPLFWQTVIWPFKPRLPQSVMLKTSIYVSYSRFWCFGFGNWRLCSDDEDNKPSDTVFNSVELLTTAGVALAELLATEGSSLKLSVMVGTGTTLSFFKQLKSILTGLSSETFSIGQSFVNTASFP